MCIISSHKRGTSAAYIMPDIYLKDTYTWRIWMEGSQEGRESGMQRVRGIGLGGLQGLRRHWILRLLRICGLQKELPSESSWKSLQRLLIGSEWRGVMHNGMRYLDTSRGFRLCWLSDEDPKKRTPSFITYNGSRLNHMVNQRTQTFQPNPVFQESCRKVSTTSNHISVEPMKAWGSFLAVVVILHNSSVINVLRERENSQ